MGKGEDRVSKWFDFYQPGWFIIETLLTYGSERILYE